MKIATDQQFEMTWNDAAAFWPQAIGLIVQHFGPLPDGPITRKDWDYYQAKLDKYIKEIRPNE